MTNFCPFMSNWELNVLCIRERCQLWCGDEDVAGADGSCCFEWLPYTNAKAGVIMATLTEHLGTVSEKLKYHGDLLALIKDLLSERRLSTGR